MQNKTLAAAVILSLGAAIPGLADDDDDDDDTPPPPPPEVPAGKCELVEVTALVTIFHNGALVSVPMTVQGCRDPNTAQTPPVGE